MLCVDEKTQVQALARSQPAFPMMPGIDAVVPDDLEVHSIADNYATHKSPTVTRWLQRTTGAGH